MIIAIDSRTLTKVPHDGIGWFTYEVIRRITLAHPGHRFVLICDRKHSTPPLEGANIEYVTLRPRNRHPLIWWVWHEFILPPVLKRLGADVLLSPDGIIPLRTDVPCVAVIHDLNHEHRPSDIPSPVRNYYRRFFPLFAAKAARVATVSHFSAKDIAETYCIDPAKIDVIDNGVAEIFSPSSGEEAEMTRKKYTGGKPYFLFVSNFSPRKNVTTLIKAYDLFRKTVGSDHLLLLAGGSLYLTGDISRAHMSSPYRSDIHFTGNVNREVLRTLYGAAEVFTFIPWFEGFGIPVVEAMRCGAPCIVSDTSSLPEVSGGAALCTGPAGAGAIAEAMARLVSDEALRRHLSQLGIINSKRYSWDNSANQMWNCILKATGKNK